MHARLPLGAILDVASLRGKPQLDYFDAQALIDNFSRKYLNEERGQVHAGDMLEALNETEVMQHYSDAGKVIVLDEDIYNEGLNWCFGNMTRTSRGLGYIILSTNRLQDETHARDLIRHEVGHMFNAPSQGREGTTESLGTHCLTPSCVMQQKLDVNEAVKYAHERKKNNSPIFCQDCESDIRSYQAPQ
jgi:predicted Zn-dependent protease